MEKRQYLLGGPLIATLACIVFADFASAQSEEFANIIYNEIDTEAMLIERARLSPTQQDAYQCRCRKRYNKFGIRIATRCSAQCVGKIAISNLYVERTGNITFIAPNPNAIPKYREIREIQIANCRTSNYSWDETLVLQVVEGVSSTATTLLGDTKNWEVKISLGSVAKQLNMNFDTTITQNTFVQTSDAVVHEQKETFTIEKPLKVTVPPYTFSKVKYSDGRRDVTVPVKIELVLDGEVVEQHAVVNNRTERVLTGEIVAPDHWSPRGVNRKLSELVEDDEQRTLTIGAEINVSGSDRNIEIVLLERELSPDSEECRF